MAIVLVQHLAAKHESILPHLLGGTTRLPVVQVSNGMLLEPDHVYVIPPNAYMGIQEGKLHLIPRPGDQRQFMPVDFFLRSLAQYAQNRAIGVILSGTASDGAIGLRELKAVGGITVAQQPESAKYDGMPRAAIATGIVDLVLSPQEIAAELVRISRHPYIKHAIPRRPGDTIPVVDAQLFRIFALLRDSSGVDFTQYKQPTIKRRLQRRMVLQQGRQYRPVHQTARAKPRRGKEPVSRHSDSRDTILPRCRVVRQPQAAGVPDGARSAGQGKPDRSASGCRAAQRVKRPIPSRSRCSNISADDAKSRRQSKSSRPTSARTLSKSRAPGVYPEDLAADVSADRLRRFFTRADGHYRISRLVRDLLHLRAAGSRRATRRSRSST